MVILLQILLAAVVVGIVLWATARLGRSRLGIALGAGGWRSSSTPGCATRTGRSSAASSSSRRWPARS